MPVTHGISTVSDGALVTVRIGHTREQAAERRRAKRPLLHPIEVRALIDTGAEKTCLDDTLASRLELEPKNVDMVNAPGLDVNGLMFQFDYDVDLTIPHSSGRAADDLTLQILEVLGLPLKARGCEAVLGRDVLASCVLIYDGTAGSFTLTY